MADPRVEVSLLVKKRKWKVTILFTEKTEVTDMGHKSVTIPMKLLVKLEKVGISTRL